MPYWDSRYGGAGAGGAGVTDGSSAAAGFTGERLTSVISVAVGSAFTTNVWGNVTSLALTPGDWDCFGVMAFATGTLTQNSMAVSIFSGNTTTDHQIGSNVLDCPLGTAAFTGGGCVASFNVNVSAATTVYLKGLLVGTVANVITGRLTARRAR